MTRRQRALLVLVAVAGLGYAIATQVVVFHSGYVGEGQAWWCLPAPCTIGSFSYYAPYYVTWWLALVGGITAAYMALRA